MGQQNTKNVIYNTKLFFLFFHFSSFSPENFSNTFLSFSHFFFFYFFRRKQTKIQKSQKQFWDRLQTDFWDLFFLKQNKTLFELSNKIDFLNIDFSKFQQNSTKNKIYWKKVNIFDFITFISRFVPSLRAPNEW